MQLIGSHSTEMYSLLMVMSLLPVTVMLVMMAVYGILELRMGLATTFRLGKMYVFFVFHVCVFE